MAGQRLGQHFLASATWRERILRLLIGAGTSCARSAGRATANLDQTDIHGGAVWIEIGAGHGEMSSLLAKQARRLVAVELDPKLLSILRQQTAAFPNVTIAPGDILALDLAQLTGGEGFYVYGNLPYYITSPIVHRLLTFGDRLQAAFLVVQLEVAERIAALPGSRDYGYFSTFVQFYSQPQILLRIPPGAFRPPPKVDSALVALRPPGERAQLGIEHENAFVKFLKLCFAQKRKTLRNNLRTILPQEKLEAALRNSGLTPSARAEELRLKDFARLFTTIESLRGEPHSQKRH